MTVPGLRNCKIASPKGQATHKDKTQNVFHDCRYEISEPSIDSAIPCRDHPSKFQNRPKVTTVSPIPSKQPSTVFSTRMTEFHLQIGVCPRSCRPIGRTEVSAPKHVGGLNGEQRRTGLISTLADHSASAFFRLPPRLEVPGAFFVTKRWSSTRRNKSNELMMPINCFSCVTNTW